MSDRPLRVFGLYLSSPCRNVLIFCKISGIPFELIEVDLYNNKHLTDEYKRLNPYGKIPAITHGDFNMWESLACILYLSDVYNIDNPYFPREPHVRGRIYAYLVAHQHFTRERLGEYLYKKAAGPDIFGTDPLPEDQDIPLRAKFENFFVEMSETLKETGYVARTDRVTIADICAYDEVSLSCLVDFDIGSFPIIKKWYDEVGAIPEVYEAHEELRRVNAEVKARKASASN